MFVLFLIIFFTAKGLIRIWKNNTLAGQCHDMSNFFCNKAKKLVNFKPAMQTKIHNITENKSSSAKN